MITINGSIFDRIPCVCYECPWWTGGRNDKAGFCTQFNLRKFRYDSVPKRCSTLFKKGFEIGGDLVITVDDDDVYTNNDN
jgi:hypothetical protein